MKRLREILRAEPLGGLVEDVAGIVMLAVFVWHLPMFLAVAAVLLEGAP